MRVLQVVSIYSILGVCLAFAKSNCIELNKIHLTEQDIFTKKEQERVFVKYKKRCLTGSVLKEILKKTSDFYIDKGFITTKPYLKPQNIRDGELDIDIVKGMVSDFIDRDTNTTSSKLKMAFFNQKTKLLNLRDIETSLEMINRVTSVDASFKIRPGLKYGESIVEVESKYSSPWHIVIGVSGEKIKDENPYLTGSVTVDNPLNINDILKIVDIP